MLTYHRVGDAEGFARQMEHLAAHYNVLSVADLLEFFRAGRAVAPRSVLITFDDAYGDVEERAWPALRRRGLPAVLFVPTAYPDDPGRVFWWDRLEQAIAQTQRRDVLESPAGALRLGTAAQRHASLSRLKRSLKTLPLQEALARTDALCAALEAPPARSCVMSWAQLRRLAAEGLDLAPHSRTHPFMNHIGRDEALDEIAGSRDDLARHIGTSPPPVFAYPDGRFCPEVLKVLHEEGFVCAFTTRRGTNDLRHTDPLRLRRINMSRDAGAPLLRARLLHSSVYLNRFRRFFDPQRALDGLAVADDDET